MENRRPTFAREVEYLAAAAGTDQFKNKPIIAVSMRLSPEEGFQSDNLILSIAQAKRLRNDLARSLRSLQSKEEL